MFPPTGGDQQCCQIGLDFLAQSGNTGCSVLQPVLPDWAGNLAQSGNAGDDVTACRGRRRAEDPPPFAVPVRC